MRPVRPSAASVVSDGRPRDGLARGAGIGLIGEAMILPAGLVSAGFLTRTVGAEMYGVLGVVMAATAPLAWIAASLLTGKPAIRLITASPRPEAMSGQIVRLNLAIGLVGWALFALVAAPFARLLGQEEALLALVLAASEILLLPLVRAHRDVLSAYGRYSASGLTAMIHHAVRLVLVIGLVLAGLDILGVVLAVIAARVAEIAWCRWHKPVPLWGPEILGGIDWRRLVSAMFLYALCLQFLSRIDVVLLSALSAPAVEIGHYAAARVVALAPDLLAVALGPPLMAAMATARAERGAGAVRLLRERTDQIAAVAAALTLSMAGATPSICRFIFGPEFEGAAPILSLLLVGGAGAVLQELSTIQLVIRNRVWTPLAIAGPMLPLAVVGAALAIGPYGALGAAAVTGAVRMAGGLVAVHALPRPRRRRMATVVAALACGMAGAGAGYAAGQAGLFLLDVAIAGAVTAALFLVTGVVRPGEIGELLRAVRSRTAGSG